VVKLNAGNHRRRKGESQEALEALIKLLDSLLVRALIRSYAARQLVFVCGP
jgi:hypothetical protein